MVKTRYKNEGILKILTILAGIIGLIYVIFGLIGTLAYFSYLAYLPTVISPFFTGYGVVVTIVFFLIGLLICILTIKMGLNPRGDPVPMNWITLLVFAILIVVFGGGIWACILLIIAFLIALIEEL